MAKKAKAKVEESTEEIESKGFVIEEQDVLAGIDELIENTSRDRNIIKSTDDKPSKPKYVFIRMNTVDAYYKDSEPIVVGTSPFKGNFARHMQLAGIQRANKLKYLTGLDSENYTEEWEIEFLAESLPTLVKAFGEDVLDPFNLEFWGTRSLKIDSEETLLDLDSADDLLTYWNIKGNGYPYVATSPEVAKTKNITFYLEEPNVEYEIEDSVSKIKDKAVAKLAGIDDVKNSVTTLFFLHKALIDASEGVTLNTPKDMVYQALRDFIDGKYHTSKKKKAPTEFIKAYDLWYSNNKSIKTKAIVNDSLHYGIMFTDKGGNIINGETNYNFGTRDKDQVVKELAKPTNQDELLALYNAIKVKWNSY